MKKFLYLALLVVGALSYASHTVNVERLRESAQTVLDTRLKANNLKVDQIRVPDLAFVPLLTPSEWRSYLFISNRSGRPLNLEICPSTIDYEVRLSSTDMVSDGGRFAMRVHLARLQACSDAHRTNVN